MEAAGLDRYSNPSQQARVCTERWLIQQIPCPACGASLEEFANNQPVADVYCKQCQEQFELKSGKHNVRSSITDGAYRTMLERITSPSCPSLFYLHYRPGDWTVQNLVLIPKYYLDASMIQARKPLAATARRAGWQGCIIRLDRLPPEGKLILIQQGAITPAEVIQNYWETTQRFFAQTTIQRKGWLIQMQRIIQQLPEEFDLAQVYDFENELAGIFPENRNIRPKIRQQLQVLRDLGACQFLGNGMYRKTRV